MGREKYWKVWGDSHTRHVAIIHSPHHVAKGAFAKCHKVRGAHVRSTVDKLVHSVPSGIVGLISRKRCSRRRPVQHFAGF